MSNFKTLAFFCLSVTLAHAAVDQTLEEKAVGKDVVEATISKVDRTSIFSNDFGFLRRLAYVETEDGLSNLTFSDRNYGGIWNVRETIVNNTVTNPDLTTFRERILQEFNISWQGIGRKELTIPLYSILAARLYMEHLAEPFPSTIEDQARYWYSYFNRNDFLNWTYFVEKVEELNNQTAPCGGKMDLVMVVDGSSSINVQNPSNFDTTKAFLADLIQSFSEQRVRFGLIVFGSEVFPIYNLDNYKTVQELTNLTLAVEYPNTKTNTNAALLEAYYMFTTAEPRFGVPQVMTIFTDGESNPKGIEHIALLESLNVSSYAVGITKSVNLGELQALAYNVSAHTFALDNFEALKDFFRLLNHEVCKIPQKPELDSAISDTLSMGERRYFEFNNLTANGVTVALGTLEGDTRGYYSFTERNPSSAMNDGELSYRGTVITPPDVVRAINADPLTVYMSVEGLKAFNNYTFAVRYGVQPTSPATQGTTSMTTEASGSGDGDGAASLYLSLVALISVGIPLVRLF